jgi:hypothetical protein
MNGTLAMDAIRAMGIRWVASLVVSKPDSDFAMILGERCGRVVEGVCRPTGKSVPLGLLPEDGFILTPFWMPPSVLLEDGFVLTPFWMPPSVLLEDGFVLTPFWMTLGVLLEDGFVLTPFWMALGVLLEGGFVFTLT